MTGVSAGWPAAALWGTAGVGSVAGAVLLDMSRVRLRTGWGCEREPEAPFLAAGLAPPARLLVAETQVGGPDDQALCPAQPTRTVWAGQTALHMLRHVRGQRAPADCLLRSFCSCCLASSSPARPACEDRANMCVYMGVLW